MAILTASQLAQLRRKFVSKLGDQAIDFDKGTINAALQAIEDWYEVNKADISTAIDAATSPYTFTAGEKRLLGAYWLLQKATREGA